jgi:N-acetyl-gamma-glutamyl-phosphate reductase
VLDTVFVDASAEEVAEGSDLVFTATPHRASMKIVPRLRKSGAKVVDLSGDFRFSDVSVYERYYGAAHEHPDIKAVYGLPELHRKEIKKADLVANPGCYPTTCILGLAPAVKAGLVDSERITADAKSGVSGAGASPNESTHFCVANESVTAYNPTGHRHMPEIEQELRAFDPSVRVSFVPHLVPVNRGLTSTLHCFLKKDTSEEEVRAAYSDFYRDAPFVRVLGVGEVPRLSAVRGSNYLDIGCFKIDEERNRLIIVSACDNLIKGAAGQAVQNMNIMLGYEETTGLKAVGLHP